MSFPLVFEELLPYFNITGSCTVFETPSYGPTTQIENNSSWGVRFDWKQEGPLCWMICGSWTLTIYLEEMGPKEFTLNNNTKTISFVQDSPHSYSEMIQFPAGLIEDGVYRLITTLTFKGPKGNPGPVVCFGDGGLIQFYTSVIP